MSLHFVPIARCPFCEEADGDGHVLVDVAALHEERVATDGHHAPDDDEPDGRLFLFNCRQEGAGPCKHLMILSSDIDWGPLHEESKSIIPDWATECDARSPRMTELREDDSAEEYFWAELHGEGTSGIRTKTRCDLDLFYERWRDPTTPEGEEKYYKISGRALFVENIDSLMAELEERGVEYQEWMKEQMLLERKGPCQDDEYEEVDEYGELEVEVEVEEHEGEL